jgi:hypothetical protein
MSPSVALACSVACSVACGSLHRVALQRRWLRPPPQRTSSLLPCPTSGKTSRGLGARPTLVRAAFAFRTKVALQRSSSRARLRAVSRSARLQLVRGLKTTHAYPARSDVVSPCFHRGRLTRRQRESREGFEVRGSYETLPGEAGCPRRRFPKRARGEDPRLSGAKERS